MLGKLHDIIKAQWHIKPWNPTRLQQRNRYIQPGSLSDTCVFGKFIALTDAMYMQNWNSVYFNTAGLEKQGNCI